jgi:CRP-like cAMP-binding protein
LEQVPRHPGFADANVVNRRLFSIIGSGTTTERAHPSTKVRDQLKMPPLRQPSSAALNAAIAQAFPLSAPETRAALAASVDIEGVTADEVVIHQGDGTWVALVVAGYAGLRRTTVDGRHLMARILSRSDLAGVPTLGLRPSGEDVVALSDGIIARWPAGELRALAKGDPGFALDILDQTVSSYEAVVGRADGLVHQDAVVRVARVLYRYRELFFTDPAVLTRAQLPMLVGTSREMTGRVIRTLETRNVVARVGRHGLELRDAGMLESLGAERNGGQRATANRATADRVNAGGP